MQSERTLWELEEKILSLVPLKSLARFRSVCKRWNSLLNDTWFINNHLARAQPQFILLSESMFCSVEVNLDCPSIKVHKLPSDIPNYKHNMLMRINYSEGLLIYATCMGFGICNPWLRKIRWIEAKARSCFLSGMGYDNSKPGKHYMIFGSHVNRDTRYFNITEFGSNAWKCNEFTSDKWGPLSYNYTVSLNGTLYWINVLIDTREHFIQSFDFSTERLKPYCVLPGKGDLENVRALEIFRGDRFSILKQVEKTRNIEIWVTKDKIKNGDGESVVWIKLMNVFVPERSSFIFDIVPPSYFIDEKSGSLVVCCHDINFNTSIYIFKGDKFHEFEINELVGFETRHRTYYPSLVPLPTGPNDGKSQFAFPRGVEVSNGVGENEYEWDDGFFDNVKKIRIGQSDTGVVFVKFYYTNHNSVVIGAAHGNVTHIPYDELLIEDDDYIEAVEGTYDNTHITSLAFRLHKNKVTPHYGLQYGTPFVLRGGGGWNWKIIGFYGRNSDVHLTALGVHRNVPI